MPPPPPPPAAPPPPPEPAYSTVPVYPYASWGKRVGGYLLDALITFPVAIPFIIGTIWFATDVADWTYIEHADGSTELVDTPVTAAAVVIAAVGFLIVFAFSIWNILWRQGTKGQTLGKQWMGIKLVRERDGQVVGVLMTFLRQILHQLDGALCYIGYLWPLWHSKRQTFTDMILDHVVIEVEK